jgi:membrane-bound lytic murein transglycosylase D
MRWLLTWCGLLLLPVLGMAQAVPASDPLPVETQLNLHLQDLERAWEVMQARSVQPSQPAAPRIRELPADDLIQAQLSRIQGEFSFELTPKVKAFIEFFVLRHADGLDAMLGMASTYRPTFERALQAAQLPMNLRHLPMALSAMNVCAVAQDGGAGLWQLNFHAAIRYGLICDQAIDERRDLLRSTTAALNYLRDLQVQSGDWMLTLAAYTCGPGGLARARLRSGGKNTFAELYPFLPSHSRDYVPAFVAACYVAYYAEEMGLKGLPIPGNGIVDRIQLSAPLGFRPVARALKLSESQLRALNPACRMEYIPGSTVPVMLCLPRGYGAQFTQLRDSIYALHARDELAKQPPKPAVVAVDDDADGDDGDPAEGPAVRIERETPAWTPPAGTVPIPYIIRTGDNLGAISQTFGVPLSQLMAANGLNSHKIKAGDPLTIHVPKAKVKELQLLAQGGVIPSTLPKQEVTPAKPVPGKPVPIKPTPPAKQAAYELYTVKSGDNLWLIAKRFPGLTEKDIMAYNGITEKIQPGLVLKIPKKKP